MNGSILVYYNPCVFGVFEKLLLFGPKCVQQLHKRDLPRTTFATDYFHILLQCLRLGVQEGVGYTIEGKNATNIFELKIQAMCHSSAIIVCCLSKKKVYFPIGAVIMNIY